MTPVEIRDNIVTYLSNNWGTITTTVAWPNADTQVYSTIASLSSPWAKIDIRFGSSRIGEQGVDENGNKGVGHRTGIVIVSFYTIKGVGVRKSLIAAGRAEDLLRLTDGVTGCIQFGEPETTENGLDPDNYYRVTTTVPFETFIGE